MKVGAVWKVQGGVRMLLLAGLVLTLLAIPAPAGASSAGGASTGGGAPVGPGGPTGSSGANGSHSTSGKPPSQAQIAATPPMGWDSWDSFGCGVNQHDIVQTANWLVASGLRDAGYRYVIIDDCWYAPTRAANGSLRPNTSKFRNGMRWLGWYLHSHGLLFGIYVSSSQSTCAQENHIYPGSTGSLGHERQDAETFASWGVDYVKDDWCSPQGTIWQQISSLETMLAALRATRRPMLFSINPNSFHTPTGDQWNWAPVANMVRMAPDLAPVWDMGPDSDWYSGILNAILEDAAFWPRAGPRHWNDPDSLVVGMRAPQYAQAVESTSYASFLNSPPTGVDITLSYQDMLTNMAMWSMLAAPLIVGADVPYLGPPARRILLNPSLISIDQDPLGQQARPIATNREVWVKPLSEGEAAVALFNPTNGAIGISATARQARLKAVKKYTVRDAWTGATSTSTGSLYAVVPAHGAEVYIVTPVTPPKPGASSKHK